jgi:hypothetical protein
MSVTVAPCAYGPREKTWITYWSDMNPVDARSHVTV